MNGLITFSNWCTLNIPRVSRPWDPTSCRKHVDTPTYFSGSSLGSNHSSLCSAHNGCSLVAIRYFSSTAVSSATSLLLLITCVWGGDSMYGPSGYGRILHILEAPYSPKHPPPPFVVKPPTYSQNTPPPLYLSPLPARASNLFYFFISEVISIVRPSNPVWCGRFIIT